MAPSIAAALFLVVHLAFLAPTLDDIDAVNFAFGVRAVRSRPRIIRTRPATRSTSRSANCRRRSRTLVRPADPLAPLHRDNEALALALWSALCGAFCLLASYAVFLQLEALDADGRNRPRPRRTRAFHGPDTCPVVGRTARRVRSAGVVHGQPADERRSRAWPPPSSRRPCCSPRGGAGPRAWTCRARAACPLPGTPRRARRPRRRPGSRRAIAGDVADAAACSPRFSSRVRAGWACSPRSPALAPTARPSPRGHPDAARHRVAALPRGAGRTGCRGLLGRRHALDPLRGAAPGGRPLADVRPALVVAAAGRRRRSSRQRGPGRDPAARPGRARLDCAPGRTVRRLPHALPRDGHDEVCASPGADGLLPRGPRHRVVAAHCDASVLALVAACLAVGVPAIHTYAATPAPVFQAIAAMQARSAVGDTQAVVGMHRSAKPAVDWAVDGAAWPPRLPSPRHNEWRKAVAVLRDEPDRPLWFLGDRSRRASSAFATWPSSIRAPCASVARIPVDRRRGPLVRRSARHGRSLRDPRAGLVGRARAGP